MGEVRVTTIKRKSEEESDMSEEKEQTAKTRVTKKTESDETPILDFITYLAQTAKDAMDHTTLVEFTHCTSEKQAALAFIRWNGRISLIIQNRLRALNNDR